MKITMILLKRHFGKRKLQLSMIQSSEKENYTLQLGFIILLCRAQGATFRERKLYTTAQLHQLTVMQDTIFRERKLYTTTQLHQLTVMQDTIFRERKLYTAIRLHHLAVMQDTIFRERKLYATTLLHQLSLTQSYPSFD